MCILPTQISVHFISCFLYKCNDINLSILDKLLMVEEIMKAFTMGFMPNSCFHLSLVLGFVVLRINSGSFVLWASVLCLSTHRVLFL